MNPYGDVIHFPRCLSQVLVASYFVQEGKGDPVPCHRPYVLLHDGVEEIIDFPRYTEAQTADI